MEFLFELKLKNSEKIFAKNLNPGVLISQIIDFKIKEKDLHSPMFIKALMDYKEEFIKQGIVVNISQVGD